MPDATTSELTKEICDDGSEIHIETWGPLDATSVTREHRYAYRCGMAADIRVCTNSYRGYTSTRKREGYRVVWNIDSGRGWRRKPWGCACATEAEALAFAAAKWEQMLTWLRRATKEGSTAAPQQHQPHVDAVHASARG